LWTEYLNNPEKYQEILKLFPKFKKAFGLKLEEFMQATYTLKDLTLSKKNELIQSILKATAIYNAMDLTIGQVESHMGP
jgi:hypothetical protein